MKKLKVISAVLCLTVLLSILPLFSGAASAATPVASLDCDEIVRPGENVSVTLNLSGADSLMAVTVSNLYWDTGCLSLVDVIWEDIEDSGGELSIKDWDEEYNQGVMAFTNQTDVNGTLLTFVFSTVKTENNLTAWVSCDVTLSSDGSTGGTSVYAINENINITPRLRGDVNGDGVLNSADTVYLLYHVHFGKELYPLARPCDANRSGAVNADDAVYLLYAYLYPERYSIGTDNEIENYFGDVSTENGSASDGFGDWKPIPGY